MGFPDEDRIDWVISYDWTNDPENILWNPSALDDIWPLVRIFYMIRFGKSAFELESCIEIQRQLKKNETNKVELHIHQKEESSAIITRSITELEESSNRTPSSSECDSISMMTISSTEAEEDVLHQGLIDFCENQVEELKKRSLFLLGRIPEFTELQLGLGDFQKQGTVTVRAHVGPYSAHGTGKRKKNAVYAAARELLIRLDKVDRDIPSLLSKCGPTDSVDRFIVKQKLLIDLEAAANAGALHKDPDSLGPVDNEKLNVAGTSIPIYGGTMVTLWNNSSRPVETRPGSSITLRGWEEEMFGIVTSVDEAQIKISVKESGLVFSLADEFQLEKVDGIRIFRKLSQAVESIKTPTKVSRDLRDVLMGLKEPTVDPKRTFKFLNKSLDRSQEAAVKFALCQRELAVIHGPPGTGKTTSLVEVILQTIISGKKVLVCAPSNIAVDNMLERLLDYRHHVVGDVSGLFVRLGHPARVSEHLQQFTLDALTQKTSGRVEELRQQISALQTDLDKDCDGVTKERQFRQKKMEVMENELQEIMKELERAKEGALLNAKVIFGTLTCCEPYGPLNLLPHNHFGLTVIDEVAQALEAACWLVIPRSPRLLLAGDHLQLPPTILSRKKEVVDQLKITLMERLLERYGPWDQRVVIMLNIQYRMNNLIMQWSSETFYHGRLYADQLVSNHTLSDMSHLTSQITGLTDTVLLMVDTKDCQMTETVGTGSHSSIANVGEARIVCHLVRQLLETGVKQEEIGVITTYGKQVELLELNLSSNFPGLEIKTVDGFQGREKESIILSLVRSNPGRNIGFLVEQRRLNVAVTRARRQLILVCDSATVSKDPFIQSFIKYMKREGKIQCAGHIINMIDITVPPSFQPKPAKSKKKRKSKKSTP